MMPGKSSSPDCSFAIRFVRSSSLTVGYRGRPRSTAERNAPAVSGCSRVTIVDSSMQDRVITGISASPGHSMREAGMRDPCRQPAVVLLNPAAGVCCHQQTPDFMSVAASPFRTVRVIGLGRAGTAIAARLRERGAIVADSDASVVLLCVPDAVIADVAATIRPGPWVAHVSGATRLQALDPHERRFSVHPL